MVISILLLIFDLYKYDYILPVYSIVLPNYEYIIWRNAKTGKEIQRSPKINAGTGFILQPLNNGEIILDDSLSKIQKKKIKLEKLFNRLTK